jgi:hypothetical protein
MESPWAASAQRPSEPDGKSSNKAEWQWNRSRRGGELGGSGREVGDRRASVQPSSFRRGELGKHHARPPHTLLERALVAAAAVLISGDRLVNR